MLSNIYARIHSVNMDIIATENVNKSIRAISTGWLSMENVIIFIWVLKKDML